MIRDNQAANPPGGVDNNGVYRDPWGNPYIITMDTSYDDQVQRSFYSLASGFAKQRRRPVSMDCPILIMPTAPDNYLYHGKVMVWSAGPDGKIDPTPTRQHWRQQGQHSELAVIFVKVDSFIASAVVGGARKFAIRNSQFAISRAFTLIELLVVISIMGLLAALAVPALKNLGKSNIQVSAVAAVAR